MKNTNLFTNTRTPCKATYEGIMKTLRSLSNPTNRAGMARFGIAVESALGISMPQIRALAKQIGKNHELAQELWASNIHEARILAGIVADPKQTSKELMTKWVHDFNSWDVCDQACGNLFTKTPYAHELAKTWCLTEEEYVRRAGFALMATLAVHDKKSPDSAFEDFFPLISQYAYDNRNFVRKAVNWALRNIGKRNMALNKKAIDCAQKIHIQESKSARWIAADALRELSNEKIQERVKNKTKK